jgi:ABC-type branched-subunit amino acid transport system ATPase component
MITKFWRKNVGVLGDFSVDLGPLTVLVGPNASGKTTFLRALRCLAMLMKMPAHGRGGTLRLGYRATIADLISRDHSDSNLVLGVETQRDRD